MTWSPTARLHSRVGVSVLALVLVLVLASGVVTSLALPAAGTGTTVLRSAQGVTLTATDGAVSRGGAGQAVPDGDVVTVATGGAAVLARGRRTLSMAGGARVIVLGAQLTEVAVGDVVAQESAVSDWSLIANDVVVSGIRGSVRVDRGYGLRVATYDGSARVDVATGASLTLGPLSEAAASGSALPSATSPLELRSDALDRDADPALVRSDTALTGLADQIDANRFAAVAFRTGNSTAPSERVLAVAIGRATGGGSAAQDAAAARAAVLRSQHASWGVVAAIVGAPVLGVQFQVVAILADVSKATTSASAAAVSDVQRELTAAASAVPPTPVFTLPGLTTPAGTTVGPTADPAPAATSVASRPVVTPTRPRPSSTTTTRSPTPRSPSTSPPPASRPTTAPAPTTAPTPSPTTDPGLVATLLGGIGGLLAPPSPSPSSVPRGTSGRATPAPTGLLGGVLGGL